MMMMMMVKLCGDLQGMCKWLRSYRIKIFCTKYVSKGPATFSCNWWRIL